MRQEREQVSAPAITPTSEPGASESNALGNLVDAFYARYYEGCEAMEELFTSGLEDMTTDILIYLVDYAMRISKGRVTFGW